tara:strand:- start:482 stop:691 length:210 start_codon:yes stop_codon:yes gene_type:complete
MKAEDFFKQKPEPTFLEDNPKSVDESDREMLMQFCWDAQIEDDEVDETVQSLIDWKNRRCDLFINETEK